MITSVSEFYKDINPSTLSGAIDVLVVEDVETGRLSCSPFHVRFGKLQLLRPQEKVVEMRVNGKLTAVQMKVGEAGESFFVLPVQGAVKEEYLTSPLVRPLPGGREGEGEGEGEGEAFTLSPEKRRDGRADKSGVDSEGEGGSGGAGHATALSDSELEIKDKGADDETRDDLMAGSPPKYSWMWGGLPRRTRKSFSMSSREELTDRPTNQTNPTNPTNSTNSTNSTSPTSPTDQTNSTKSTNPLTASSSDAEVPMPTPTPLPKMSDLFEWVNLPKILKHNYEGFAALIEEKRDEALSISLFRRSDLAKDVPLEIAVEEEEEEEEDGIAFVKSAVERELLCPVPWKAFEEGPGSLVEEIQCREKRCLMMIDERVMFSGCIGYHLVVGRMFFGQILCLEACQRLVAGDSKHSSPSSPPSAPSKKQSGSTGGWRWWSRSSVTSTAEPQTASSPSPSGGGSGSGSPSRDRDEEGDELATTTTTTTTLSPDETSPTPTVVPPHALPPSAALPPAAIGDVETIQPTVSATTTAETKYQKTLRLPHEILEQLDLQPGPNTMSFTVHTRLQGTATCLARIFRWRSDTKIVISDVDGTITKSDALGHLFAIVGRDWTHSDIAKLYSDIERNGYRFVYLTSRSLGQANSTRGYLRGVEQNGRFQLPDGPVIMSPDRLLAALRREVVLGNPQEFKIACLKDLQLLFFASSSSASDNVPTVSEEEIQVLMDSRNPFYAGFGNRTNDVAAYAAIGIPPQRIFVVNPAGTLAVEPLSDHYLGSYAQLIELVDQIFPPLAPPETRVHAAEEYNDFWYWRRPLSIMVGVQRDAAGRSVLPIGRALLDDAAVIEEAEARAKDLIDEDSGEEEEESLVPAYYI